jgi:threonylcarbamoyladenosine tRNA methylthiotransferase MtaB
VSVETVTFGCRLNWQESDALRRSAEAAGASDMIIVNTCAVTAEAVAQGRQRIRKLRRDNPGKRIVVTGCAAQTEPRTFAAMPEVDQVIGNAGKVRPGLWLAPEAERVVVNDIMELREVAPHLSDAVDLGQRTRATVQVQNGCDHRCTFCIIPHGRGNSRSAPMGDVVNEVRRLVEAGTREVVLTGVDLTSYGGDLPGAPRLGTLVAAILRHVPELPRLRLSSIDSVEADDALIEAIATEPRLAPHLHLSLQAGDDLILKRMRFCEQIRKARPDIVFGADIIAGFPTEDEAMFANSLDLVDACGLTFLHVFPFSPRRGTPAARMPQVRPEVIRERAERLRAKGAVRLADHLDARVGRSIEVLTERGGVARAADFTPVRLGRNAPAGAFVTVAAMAHDGHRLIAA